MDGRDSSTERRKRLRTKNTQELSFAERAQRTKTMAGRLAKLITEDPSNVPHNFILVGLESAMLENLFTAERIRLLLSLRYEGPAHGMEQLAERLGRDLHDVDDLVRELEFLGLVEIEQMGSRMRIFAPDCPLIIV